MNTPTAVTVPGEVLREVLEDGCCPVHLRLRLARALRRHAECSEDSEVAVVANSPTHNPSSMCDASPLTALDPACLAGIAAHLSLIEVLSLRAGSREALQWAMQRTTEEEGALRQVHDRIRTRLWMRRIADLTTGTEDESVFETRMRSYADETLRRRMETEMHEALENMEQQIRAFQAEVDRRMEEQEQRVKAMVEERVQEELDAILAAEIAKVQAMVEEQVREKVGGIFQREVRRTVRDLQVKLDALVAENEQLRDAFAEANLRAKSFFWAMHPNVMSGLGRSLFSLPRRLWLATRIIGP